MKLIFLILGVFLLLFGCNNNEASEETNIVEKEAITEEQWGEGEEAVSSERLWPEAFEPNAKSFTFPTSLAEAENTPKGKWWEKLDASILSKEEREAAVDYLWTVIEDKSTEEQRNIIKQFIIETYFPELPALTTFSPRGKINLEEVEEKSNIKLNGREVKENINVAIILDASGSMKNVQDGKTLMEIAKESIRDFASNLPENAKVSLTIYGHKGTGAEEDKQLSCTSIDDVYALSTYNTEEFSTQLNAVVPSGWTAMGAALEQVGEKLKNEHSENATNVIYLVSDGKETCGGNPAEVAKTLADSNIDPIINVIGLAVNYEDAKALEEIAKNAEGRYITARNQQELDQEFQRTNESIEQWVIWYAQNITEALNQSNGDTMELISLNNQMTMTLILFTNYAKQVNMELMNRYKLDREVYNLVHDDITKFYNEIMDQKTNTYNEKLDQINQTYNETKEAIDQNYENRP